jgi:DNA-binding transcriptional LysR family regulator
MHSTHSDSPILGWKLLSELEVYGSLTAAAQACGVELWVASKTLVKLEQATGIQLINRHTRPKTLTLHALRLLPKIRRLLSAQAGLTSEIAHVHEEDSTALRISLGTGSINSAKMSALHQYEDDHNHLRLEIIADQTHQAVLDGTVDIAVVSYPVEHPDLTVIPLGTCANLPLASPRYLAKYGTPHAPEDLANHTLLLIKSRSFGLCTTLYRDDTIFDLGTMQRYTLGSQPDLRAVSEPIKKPKTVVTSYYPALLSCLQGQGIVLDLALGFARDRLEKHELVPVLDGWHRQPWKKSLVVRHETMLKPHAADFVNWFKTFEPSVSHAEWTYWYQYFGINVECVHS